MSLGSIQTINGELMTPAEVAQALRRFADALEAGAIYEGSVQAMLPDEAPEGWPEHQWERRSEGRLYVHASIRYADLSQPVAVPAPTQPDWSIMAREDYHINGLTRPRHPNNTDYMAAWRETQRSAWEVTRGTRPDGNLTLTDWNDK